MGSMCKKALLACALCCICVFQGALGFASASVYQQSEILVDEAHVNLYQAKVHTYNHANNSLDNSANNDNDTDKYTRPNAYVPPEDDDKESSILELIATIVAGVLVIGVIVVAYLLLHEGLFRLQRWWFVRQGIDPYKERFLKFQQGTDTDKGEFFKSQQDTDPDKKGFFQSF